MRERRGFTILELLLLLSGLAVLAAWAIPAWFGRPNVTLENASTLLAQDVRAAQNRAAYRGLSCSIVFDDDGYAVRDEEGLTIQNPRTELPFDRRYSYDGVFRGVSIVAIDFGPDDTLRFDDNGLVLGGGSVTISFNGETRKLHVEEGSGRMRLDGSSSGWKDLGF